MEMYANVFKGDMQCGGGSREGKQRPALPSMERKANCAVSKWQERSWSEECVEGRSILYLRMVRDSRYI